MQGALYVLRDSWSRFSTVQAEVERVGDHVSDPSWDVVGEKEDMARNRYDVDVIASVED